MPAVWWVTNGNDSGSGSLRAQYEAAEAAGNGQEIIIADEVSVITLSSPLDSGAMNFTTIEITGEDPSNRPVIKASTEGAHQFLNHSGNNGVTIILEHLKFENFGANVVVENGITVNFGHGGVIKTVAPLYLVHCDFLNNVAEGNGGAIFSEYSIAAEDCLFFTNFAGADGGAIYSEPENTAAGISITDCEFNLNSATDDGGAICFKTVAGTLGIYGDSTVFIMNGAGDKGGAVFQFGGAIEAISSSSADTGTSGFQFDVDSGIGNDLFLEELELAHIDIVVNGTGAGDSIFLHSFIPPSQNNYWSDINESRVSGGINSNWPI